jgi:hypothetical protein
LIPTPLDQNWSFEVYPRTELDFRFTSEYIGLAVQNHPLFENFICATLGVGRTRYANQSYTHKIIILLFNINFQLGGYIVEQPADNNYLEKSWSKIISSKDRLFSQPSHIILIFSSKTNVCSKHNVIKQPRRRAHRDFSLPSLSTAPNTHSLIPWSISRLEGIFSVGSIMHGKTAVTYMEITPQHEVDEGNQENGCSSDRVCETWRQVINDTQESVTVQ